MNEWEIDTTVPGMSPDVGGDDLGWLYAKSYQDTDWAPQMIKGTMWIPGLTSFTTCVRRRRWVRVRKQQRHYHVRQDLVSPPVVSNLSDQTLKSRVSVMAELEEMQLQIAQLLDTAKILPKDARAAHAARITELIGQAEALKALEGVLKDTDSRV